MHENAVKEHTIVCENTEAILEAISRHPNAVLHLTKRQIHKLSAQLRKGMQAILEAKLKTLYTSYYDKPLYITVDEQGGLLLNFSKGLEVSRATTDTLIEKLMPKLKDSVHIYMQQAVDTYVANTANTEYIVHCAVKQAFTKCATKIMEAALSVDTAQPSEGEQTCTKS